MALPSTSSNADAGAANDSRVVFDLELNTDDSAQPTTAIDAAAGSDDYTAIVSVNSGRSQPVQSGAESNQDSTVLKLKLTSDIKSHVFKRTGRCYSGSAAQSQSSGTGIVHTSPKFSKAINAAQRTIERHISQRELGHFLRSAAEEFTVTQMRRNSISVFCTPTRDITIRRRADSGASVQSEPPIFSSSLPAESSVPSASDCNADGTVATKNFTKPRIAPFDEYRIRALSGASNRSKSGSEPLTPPPTACVHATPFTFDGTVSTDVTGAIARLAVFERDQDSDPDAE